MIRTTGNTMTSEPQPYDAFAERIAYEGALRLQVRPLDAVATGAANMHTLNASVLACVASLPDDVKLPEEDSAAARQLARVNARLDVLTELLVRALEIDAQLPRPTPARLNTLGLSSDAVPDLPAGTRVRASIHFDACRAVALQLDGRIAAGDGRVFVAFTDLDTAARDALDSLVFRHHRRRVAEARRHPEPGNHAHD